MNKIKESLKENIITKESLKMKIENEIENKELKRTNTYLKPIGFTFATLLIFFGIGFYFFNNSNDNSLKKKEPNNKEIFKSKMSNSANYSMTILLNLDNYLAENNLLSYNDDSASAVTLLSNNNNEDVVEIDAKEIVDVEEFKSCNGTVIIEKDLFAYNYTVNGECSNDPEGASNLTIKRYDGINNMGLNALHKLEPISGGYVGLFEYSKNNADKCKDNKYECENDGFAVAKLNEQGDINNINGITREDLKVGYEKTIQIGDFFALNDAYYVSYTIGGNESYKEVPFKDMESNWIAKFDSNLNLVWNKEITKIPVIKTIKVGNTIGLVTSINESIYNSDNLVTSVHLLDSATGNVNNIVEFELVDSDSKSLGADTLIYANNAYYIVFEKTYCDPNCETESIRLSKYDNNGRNVFSKDIATNLNLDNTIENPNDFHIYRDLSANNENIFIRNYQNPYKPGYISVFDQNGEFIINHSSLNYNRVVYEYDNQYSLIQGASGLSTSDLKFTVNTFDKTGNLIKEAYYEAYSNEHFYKNEYLATNDWLVAFSSSFNNNGTLLLLYFN